MKLPEPDTHYFDEDTRLDEWSYSKELVEHMLAQADKDFSDGMTVVHLQVADQMRRKYEPVLKLAWDALYWTTPIGGKPVKQTQDAMDAIRKVLA